MTTAEQHLATTIAGTPTTSTTMKALVYHGPGKRAWEEKPRPTVQEPGDAIVRITTSKICGTDLHILKGDLPGVTDGRIHRPRSRASRNWCLRVSRGRQGHRLVRHCLPAVRLLQTKHVFPLLARRLVKLVSHRFAMNDILKAYDTFANTAKEGALKVVLKA